MNRSTIYNVRDAEVDKEKKEKKEKKGAMTKIRSHDIVQIQLRSTTKPFVYSKQNITPAGHTSSLCNELDHLTKNCANDGMPLQDWLSNR